MSRRLFAGLAFVASLVASLAPAPLHAQVAQWSYDVNPVTGNGRATYPGDVTVKTLAGGGCVQADSAGLLTLAAGACSTGGGVSLSTPQTWTATQTFAGASGVGTGTLSISVENIGEVVASAGSIPATINFDVLSASVDNFTTAAAANWTVNLRGDANNSLNSVMAIGQALTVALVTNQGATPFFANVIKIDGTTVTPKWQGGAPSAGNASGLDVYTFTVIKTASATYTVLASQVQFK